MKKKVLSILLCAAMVLSLAACGSKQEAAPAAPAEEKTEEAAPAEEAVAEAAPAEEAAELTTVTPGKLTVATSPDFAPYEFYALDESGTPTLAGFDLALAQYIADYLGLELDIVPMDFDGCLMEVGMGNVDIALAGLSPDPKRADAMDFSDLYYMGGQSLVCLKDNAAEFPSLEVANDPKFTIGAQIGSIQVDLAMENTPDANIVQLTKVTEIIAEILSGKMDAGYIETEVAKSYQKNYPELEIVLDVPYEEAGSAVGIAKGNDALVAAINEAIAAALADGSMNDFVAEANELAAGEKYEGLLDENGNVQ